MTKALLRYVEQYAGHFVAFTALERLRLYLFSKIWPQAPAIMAQSRTGDLLSRVTKDIDRIEVFFAHTIAPVTSAIIVPIISLVVVAQVATPGLALVAAPFLLVAAFGVPFIGGRTGRKVAGEQLRRRGENLHFVTETISGVREIIGFDYTERRLGQIDSRSQILAENGNRSWWLVGLRRGCAHALMLSATLTIAVVGGKQLAAGTVSLAELSIAIAIVLATFPAARGLEDVISDLDKALAASTSRT